MSAPISPFRASPAPPGPRPRGLALGRQGVRTSLPGHLSLGSTAGGGPAPGQSAAAASTSAAIAAANAATAAAANAMAGDGDTEMPAPSSGPGAGPSALAPSQQGAASQQQQSQHLVSFLVWNVSGLSEVTSVLHETWAYIGQFDVTVLSETQTPATLHQQLPNHIVHTILASTAGRRGEGLLLAVRQQLPFSITHWDANQANCVIWLTLRHTPISMPSQLACAMFLLRPLLRPSQMADLLNCGFRL